MAWTETARAKYRRPLRRFESDLTDAEWARLSPLLPAPSRTGRPRQVDLREVVNALLYQLMTGCQWRALPPCFPKPSTVRYYFYRWRNEGLYERLFVALREPARELDGRLPAATAGIIDAQSVKTTESGGPAGYDAGKNVKNSFSLCPCRATGGGALPLAPVSRARPSRDQPPPWRLGFVRPCRRFWRHGGPGSGLDAGSGDLRRHGVR